jgi:hypothetical protein
MNSDLKLIVLTAFGAVLGAVLLNWLAANSNVIGGSNYYSNPVLN